MNIRIATFDDLQPMVDIYNQAILTNRCTADTEIFTFEERIDWFKAHENDAYPLYVYEIDNRVVGYLYFSAYRPGRKAMISTAEISYYLHEDYLGKGIGSNLMTFAINKAPELGFKTLVAILLSINEPSIGLLKKFNFEAWGTMIDIAEFDHGTCSHLYYGLKI